MFIGVTISSMSLMFLGRTNSLGQAWLLVPFLTLFAVGYGGNNTIRAVLLTEDFDRSKFGTIYVYMTAIAMIGTITGAPLAGWLFDNWGSYQGIWFTFAGLAAAALIIIATTTLFSQGQNVRTLLAS